MSQRWWENACTLTPSSLHSIPPIHLDKQLFDRYNDVMYVSLKYDALHGEMFFIFLSFFHLFNCILFKWFTLITLYVFYSLRPPRSLFWAKIHLQSQCCLSKQICGLKSVCMHHFFISAVIQQPCTYVWCAYNCPPSKFSALSPQALTNAFLWRSFQSATCWALSSSLPHCSEELMLLFISCDKFCGLKIVCWWAAEGENLVPCWNI